MCMHFVHIFLYLHNILAFLLFLRIKRAHIYHQVHMPANFDKKVDKIDARILSELQTDGRLGNNELADLIGLSASQCSRRRARLEEAGFITGYHARVDKESAGAGLTSIISVTLSAHSENNAQRFRELLNTLPNVQEAYALTGEMDYQLKIVTVSLQSLSAFINDVLLPHESIRQVKTSVVLETIKETTVVPVSSNA